MKQETRGRNVVPFDRCRVMGYRVLAISLTSPALLNNPGAGRAGSGPGAWSHLLVEHLNVH